MILVLITESDQHNLHLQQRRRPYKHTDYTGALSVVGRCQVRQQKASASDDAHVHAKSKQAAAAAAAAAAEEEAPYSTMAAKNARLLEMTSGTCMTT